MSITETSYLKNLPGSFAETHFSVASYLGEGIFLTNELDIGVMFEVQGIYDAILLPETVAFKVGQITTAIQRFVSTIKSQNKQVDVVTQVIQEQVSADTEGLIKECKGDMGAILKLEQEFSLKVNRPITRKSYITFRICNLKNGGEKKSFMSNLIQKVSSTEDDKILSALDSNILKYKKTINTFESSISTFSKCSRLDEYRFKKMVGRYFTGDYEVCNSRSTVIENPSIEELNLQFTEEINPAPEENTFTYSNGRTISSYYLSSFPSSFGPGKMSTLSNHIPAKEWTLIWTMSDLKTEVDFNLGFAARKSGAIDLFKQRVSIENPYGKFSLKLLVFDKDTKYVNMDDFDTSLMIAMDSQFGGRFSPEKQIVTHQFTTSLPLNCSTYNHEIKVRSWTKDMRAVSNYLPLFSENEKHSDTRYFMSNNGYPTGFNRSEGEDTKITIGIGAPRTGKSVEDNQYTVEFGATHENGVIRVIDIDTSKVQICEAMNGKIVKFDSYSDSGFTLSPFTIPFPDENDYEDVTSLIELVLTKFNSGINFQSTHKNLISRAVEFSYNFTNQKLDDDSLELFYPTWKDVQEQLPIAKEELEGSGSVSLTEYVEDIIRWSSCLNTNTPVGKLFGTQIKRENDDYLKFAIYDLDGVSDKNLLLTLSFMTFMHIGRDFRKMDRSRSKLLCLDEFGVMVNLGGEAEDVIVRAIDRIIKAMPKKNVEINFTSNNVADFTGNAIGRKVVELATGFRIGPLKSLIHEFREKFCNHFNEAEMQIIETLSKTERVANIDNVNQKVRSSSFYYKFKRDGGDYCSTATIFQSPYMDALTTSSGLQRDLYKKLRDEGKTALGAVKYMSENHPYAEGLNENSH